MLWHFANSILSQRSKRESDLWLQKKRNWNPFKIDHPVLFLYKDRTAAASTLHCTTYNNNSGVANAKKDFWAWSMANKHTQSDNIKSLGTHSYAVGFV